MDITLEDSLDGVALWTPDGRVVHANKAAADLAGVASFAAIAEGKFPSVYARLELYGADGTPVGMAQLPVERALHGELPEALETRVRNVEAGTEHWLLVAARPVYDGASKIVCAVGLFRDITQARKSPESLAAVRAHLEARTAAHAEALGAAITGLREQARWILPPASDSAPDDAPRNPRDLLDQAPDAMILTERGGTIVFANRAVERVFGWSPAELVGQPVELLMPARSREAHGLHRARYEIAPTARAMSERDDLRGIRKDGTEFAVEVSLSPLQEVDGPRVLAVIRDLSARKLAEVRFQGLIRTEAALVEGTLARDPGHRLATFTSVSDGVIAVDASGRVQMLNPVAVRLTGCAAAEAVGKPVSDVFRIRKVSGGPLLADPVAHLMADRVASAPDGPTLLVHRDGTERPIGESAALSLDAAGAPRGIVLVFRDISSRDQLEEEIARTAKLGPLGLLAGGIAHDFNNLLTGVLGNLSLALETLPEQAESRAFVADAERAAQRARLLTGQLLTFSKGGEPVRKPVALAGLVRDAAERAMAKVRVRVEFAIDADLAPANADVSQIGHVIEHIVMNAAQATPHGGAVHITCRNCTTTLPSAPEVTTPCVCIEVRDHGPGIAADILPRIFYPYFTTRRSGMGLGLALVHAIVRKHEGRIDVESSPGQGATFRIFLPACEALAPIATRPSRRTGRILVMDDDPMLRDVISAMLKAKGYDYEIVDDGVAALLSYERAKAEGNPFALVILDLTVPAGMGGLEALRRLRAGEPHVRAIASSGYSEDPVMASPHAHGFADSLPKPFTASELDGAVQRVLAEAGG